jgi:hypothetical protein
MSNTLAAVVRLSAVAACLLAVHASADTAQFVAVEDAWIYGAAQSTNYGTADPLELSGASGAYKRQCLFRWNLSSLGPVTIQSAQIVLTTRASTDWGGNLPAQLVKIDAAWNEMTVTWANRPATSTVATDTLTLNQAYADPWTAKTWTLNAAGLALVQSWANGQSNYGLQLMPVNPSADSHQHFVRPREATDANQRPKLIVTYLPECLPPGEVADLSLLAADATRLWLGWTAPAAMIQGISTGYYELRYSTSPIDAGNFAAATLLGNVPSPEAQGTPQSHLVEGLSPNNTYYFAMKCHGPCDGLVSGLSNVLQAATTPPDTTPPAAVSDLAISSIGTVQLLLEWSATGDDGMTGFADRYDVRYSTALIDAGNFDSAAPISQSLTPKAPGQPESLPVTGLTPDTTYWFAVKVIDESDNASAISNVASARTEALDVTPPATITDLAASNATSWSVKLTWTAPGDDGVLGTATSYDVRYSTSSIDEGNWAVATRATGEPAPQSPGSAETFTVTGLTAATQYYFAIKTSDEIPNVSALSNVVTATTLVSGPGTGPTPALAAHYLSLLDDPNNLTETWSFAFNPDIHIDRYGYGDNVNYIIPMFERWAAAQHKFGVIIGDLGGIPGAETIDQAAHLMEVYNSVANVPPMLITIGSHECEIQGKGYWLETLYPGVVPDLDGENWDRYRYFSFDYRGIHFVVLDTNKGKQYTPSYVGGILPPDEWQWLEDDLDASRGKLTVVLLHEVVVTSSAVWNWTEAQKLIQVLYRYPDVKWLLQGHIHEGYRYQFEHIGIVNPRVWSDNLALRFQNGVAQLCNVNADGSLGPTSPVFPDLDPLVLVPRARLTADRAWLYENPAGSTAWQITVSTQFIDDPNANTSYLYDWQAPVHSSTGRTLALVAGGGQNDAFATYAAPTPPAGDAKPYKISCTITGNEFGNTVTNTAVVKVRRLGDINDDGHVDVTDVLALASTWGKGLGAAGYDPMCDFNRDDRVDVSDLLILAGNWGQ